MLNSGLHHVDDAFNFCLILYDNIYLIGSQAAAVSRFWKNHKSKIHDVIVKRSIFGNRLKEANWRIDLKAHSRHLEQINSPAVIYELELEQGSGNKVIRNLFFVPFMTHFIFLVCHTLNSA